MEKQRKVTFVIDDLAFFKVDFSFTDNQMKETFREKESFKAIYTLTGYGKNLDRYTLTDFDGNKIPLDSLNGYQKGIILNDCCAYFTGGKYFDNSTFPCGVVEIKEEFSAE